MIALALLILLAALAMGMVARRSATAKSPLAAHFPGQPIWVRPTPPIRLRVWVGAAAVLTVATIGALIVFPIAGLVAAFFTITVLGLLAAIMHRYASGCDEMRAAVDAYEPRVAMPYAGKTGVHIGMWSPWIERTGVPWCIVARTPALFHELAAAYEIPIIQGQIPPSVRGALYPHGAAKNSEFIEASGATHVFLGHGDSDKPLSASDRVLQYDVITVAGQAAIDRFTASGVHVPPEKLRIIGRPQTEGIAVTTGRPRHPATVLYAPTWRHADDSLNVSSLAVADRIVQELLDRGCTVHFRRHFAGANHAAAEAMIADVNRLLEADAETTGRPHQWGQAAMDRPMFEAFNDADVMVSDVSGIVVDFMASLKPFVMYAAQFDDTAAFRASHPTATSAYVIDAGLRDLGSALDAALGDDPLAPARVQQAGYYLGGDDRAEPAQRFMDLVREVSQSAPRHP